MDLLHLVDRLEELVASAQKMPIGNRAILDRRRLLDVVDQMRIAVPQEVREAQDIVAHREAIRREAEEEGRILLAQAEERAARLVESNEITQAARQRAEEIAHEAEARLEDRIAEANADIQQRINESRQIAREQMAAADDYARDLLGRLNRQLEAFVGSVRNGMDQLEPQAPTLRRDTAAAPIAREAPARRETMPEPEFEDEDTYDEPAYDSATESRSARPVPLRRAQDADDDLENLLRPRRREVVQQPAPAIIDDFDNEPLDDDAVLPPRRDTPREERSRGRIDDDFDE